RERQLEGITKAKERGVYKGRKPSIDPNEVRRLRAEGKGPTAIVMRWVSVGRACIGCSVARRQRRSLASFCAEGLSDVPTGSKRAIESRASTLGSAGLMSAMPLVAAPKRTSREVRVVPLSEVPRSHVWPK